MLLVAYVTFIQDKVCVTPEERAFSVELADHHKMSDEAVIHAAIQAHLFQAIGERRIMQIVRHGDKTGQEPVLVNSPNHILVNRHIIINGVSKTKRNRKPQATPGALRYTGLSDTTYSTAELYPCSHSSKLV